MTYLLLALCAILAAFAFCSYLTMKKAISWRYKALIYGILTFFMLTGVFFAFEQYDMSWKVSDNALKPAGNGSNSR